MASVSGYCKCLLIQLPLTENSSPERFNAFLSRAAKKRERERSLSSDRPRSVNERGCPLPRRQPRLVNRYASDNWPHRKVQSVPGCVSAIDSNARTIWITDHSRGDGKCFVVRVDEKVDCFCRTLIYDSIRQSAQRIATAKIIKFDKLSPTTYKVLDYVIRQFHLIFGTGAGSSLRHRLARSPRSNWIPRVSRSEAAVHIAS